MYFPDWLRDLPIEVQEQVRNSLPRPPRPRGSEMIESVRRSKVTIRDDEWATFDQGVHMYQGKKTFFFNGQVLRDGYSRHLIYDFEEKCTWEMIVVMHGVQIIPWCFFQHLEKLETVIIADTVTRIEMRSFAHCSNLVYVKLSRQLQLIGEGAFDDCSSLASIFLPPSCQVIHRCVFSSCKKLLVFHIPSDTELDDGDGVMDGLLTKTPPFKAIAVPTWSTEFDETVRRFIAYNREVNQLFKDINNGQEYALHRLCASYDLNEENIYQSFNDAANKKDFFKDFYHKQNAIGVTPAQYLEANPFSNVDIVNLDELSFCRRYVQEMIGEVQAFV
ncbi:hypothetical protein CTEN210_13654 [Chaetoceros tenuissimus]|uniref:Uncharacterized protein n=1 Tax=Chaetoceros tenuissimus TaxID=426638 RepID=A0AAD3D3Q5_9STRA|nr:hypothetical protein CTEN210_13654 [Chaetoceros tenuissimus]